MDFMDKTNAFLEKLEESGISISNQDGETAVICEDCVAVIKKQGDTVGVVSARKNVPTGQQQSFFQEWQDGWQNFWNLIYIWCLPAFMK